MVCHFQDQVMKDCDAHLDCILGSLALGKANCPVTGHPAEVHRGPPACQSPDDDSLGRGPEPEPATPGFLSHRDDETVSVCHFQPLNFGAFFMQQDISNYYTA